jgi:hypothetical protein
VDKPHQEHFAQHLKLLYWDFLDLRYILGHLFEFFEYEYFQLFQREENQMLELQAQVGSVSHDHLPIHWHKLLTYLFEAIYSKFQHHFGAWLKF